MVAPVWILVMGLCASMASPSWGDVVTDWNTITMQTNRNDTTLPGPTYSSRTFAMVHLAIFDAVNAVVQAHRPYLYTATAEDGTSIEAAASQAAHDVLVSIYPDQTDFLDTALQDHLAEIADGPGKTAGVDLGNAVAETLIRVRTPDNAFDDPGEYPDGTEPGEWRRTPPDFRDPIGVHYGQVTPFGLRSGSQFRVPAPPDLTSPEYAAALNEVKAFGAVEDGSRTEDQTEIGIFWAYDRGGLGPPTILYNQALQVIATLKGNTVDENARFFALVNMAQGDAGISCWETKYEFDLWRPITGIREAASDGNPDTEADPAWTPLGAPGGGVVDDFTPPFPAYNSGHSTFGGAVFQMVRNFYGTDDLEFVLASDELPGVTRTYTSFSQAEEENAFSRIYLGVHWKFDCTEGVAMGRKVANEIFQNHLRPKNDGDINKDGKVDAHDLLIFQQSWYEKGKD